jgi:hypothetical protein
MAAPVVENVMEAPAATAAYATQDSPEPASSDSDEDDTLSYFAKLAKDS